MERLKGYTTLPFHSTLRVLHLQVESAIYPYVPIPTNMPQPVGDANTYLDGSGNINAVGGTVSGTYFVSGASTTGWAVDGGTFTGARTN